MMRKHVAAAGMYIRINILRVIAILLVTVTAEVLLFCRAASMPNTGLEDVIDRSGVMWAMAAAFILMTVQLCAAGGDRGGRQNYTLQRLALQERTVTFWQMAVNALYYLLFWTVQGLLLIILCVAVRDPGDILSGQALFLACWRSPLLHGLIPMGEVLVWIRNAVFCAALGIVTAKFSWCRRRGKFGVGVLFAAAACLLSFLREVGKTVEDTLVILFLLVVVAAAVTGIVTEEEEYDEKDQTVS